MKSVNQKIEGIVRHVLTLVAGFLMATNILPEEIITEAQSILANLVAIVFAAVAFVRPYITKATQPAEPEATGETTPGSTLGDR